MHQRPMRLGMRMHMDIVWHFVFKCAFVSGREGELTHMGAIAPTCLRLEAVFRASRLSSIGSDTGLGCTFRFFLHLLKNVQN